MPSAWFVTLSSLTWSYYMKPNNRIALRYTFVDASL